jgi:hypothetical protein
MSAYHRPCRGCGRRMTDVRGLAPWCGRCRHRNAVAREGDNLPPCGGCGTPCRGTLDRPRCKRCRQGKGLIRPHSVAPPERLAELARRAEGEEELFPRPAGVVRDRLRGSRCHVGRE